MAQGFSAETVGVLDGTKNPPAKMDGRVVGGRARIFQATFDLSLATVKKATGDTNVCFRIPADWKPVLGWITASVTMGASATIAIGNASSAAKYRAAAVHTTVGAPVLFMTSTASDDNPLTAYEDVIFTIGTADLPGTGILQIFLVCAGL